MCGVCGSSETADETTAPSTEPAPVCGGGTDTAVVYEYTYQSGGSGANSIGAIYVNTEETSDNSKDAGVKYKILSVAGTSTKGTVSVCGYGSVSGAITIPETVTFGEYSYTVTAIEANAFKNCSALTSITIPSSVTTIGDGAFEGTGATCATHRFTNSADCDVCDFTCSHTSYDNGVCTLCGYVCPHTGGTATCKELAVCDTCGSAYGKLAAHTPVAGSYADKGDGNHSFTCSVCGTVTEAHSFGTGNACVCGLTITGYNLWVGGTQVTSANASDVLGEDDEDTTVTYDAATKTLTLNGANLTGGYSETVIYSSESLNVVLAAGSANTLSGQNYGIRVEGDVLTISGTGSLTSTANFDGMQGKSVTISGGSITATGNTSYGIKGSTVAISGGTVTAYGGAHGVEGEITLSDDAHVTITSENNAVNGSLSNTTTGWCRGGNDETFTTTITSPEGNKYFEYIGASHVTYTNKDAQNHTVACAHGISFDEAHKYENSICTACRCEGGIIDVSILSSDLIITDTGLFMNGKNYLYEGNYTLSGTTSYGVIFDEGEHQLTANNLKIEKGNGYTGSAIDLKNGAKLHLVLAEENTLTGGWEGSGIRVNEGTSLTISGNGILHAGYQRGSNAAYGAAIGGYCNSNFGTIIINGGTIYANGERGASIGSGSRYGTSNTMAGTIVLNGGTIYADLIGNAASSGAVLKGSGAAVYCDSIQADTSELNAIVYSKNGTSATYYCNDFIVTGDIANCSWDQANSVLNINGGTVAVSNKDKNTATSQRIYIQGTANVTLDGVNISSTTGAPIEIRDYNDTNVTLTLSGSNTLISQAANKAAVHKARGQQGTNSDAASLTITGSGSLTAVGGSNAAGIGGGGYRGDTHNIIINSGTIYATGTGSAAGVGSSDDGSTWNIVINGGNITANGQPGIGANTTNWQGQKNAAITGGTVITNSYVGSTPTGGLVSTDGGKTYTVYSDYTLSQNLTIDPTGKLTVAEDTTLTIADGVTLTNKGVLVNYGTIAGDLSNEGTIYNMGTLPASVGGTVHEQYVTVNSGSGTGNYAKGSTVTITADAPTSGKMFTGWTVELGTITLTDGTKAETTFAMPAGCVIVRADYADIMATITDSNGNVTPYKDDFVALRDWRSVGGTLTVYTDIRSMYHMEIPDNGVLDLNGHTLRTEALHINNSCTIQNGTVTTVHDGLISADAVITFKNVTLAKDYRDVQITNNGTIVDAGLTLNGVTISGGTTKTGLIENRVTLSGIPDGGYVFDGNAHEPTVKYNDVALVKGTDYTVTFSNSSGGDSTTNAGTVTMTITGTGSYAGTVTKTYTISKATLTVTAENKEITYGDAVPTYTVTYNGFVSNENEDNLDGTLTFDCAYAQFADKGEYTITPKGYESGNYTINYVPGTLTVNPAPVTITGNNAVITYSDSDVDLRTLFTIDENAGEADYSIIDLTGDGNFTTAPYLYKVDKVGTFTVLLTTAANGNYAAGEATVTLTVNKAVASAAAPKAEELTYNGSEQTLIAAGSTNDGELVYSLTEDGEYSAALPKAKNAGAYHVWYKVIGDSNHTDATPVKLTVKIAKADPGIGAVTAGVVTDTLETSAIVLTRANTTVPGTLTVDAEQTLKPGENTIHYTFAPKDTTNYKSVTGTVTVMMAPVADIAESMNGITESNVTSDDKANLQNIVDTVTGLLKDENLTAEVKAKLEQIKVDAEALLKAIEDADKAADTEHTAKVEDVTAENVTPDDKSALEKAKADLVKALDENGGNYTEEEKKAIEDEIQRIEDAITALENAQDVTESITQLPETVEPDDEEAAEKILDAKKAYDELTDHEKSLVDETPTKEKLDGLVAALTDYKIIKGNGGKWTKGSSYGLSFTANGPFSKFVGIEVDGEEVVSTYYTAEDGSTIITLKQSFLKRLSTGEHTITVMYTDGETSGAFKILAQSATPATGDDSSIMLYGSMSVMSLAALAVLLITSKKRKQTN